MEGCFVQGWTTNAALACGAGGTATIRLLGQRGQEWTWLIRSWNGQNDPAEQRYDNDCVVTRTASGFRDFLLPGLACVHRKKLDVGGVAGEVLMAESRQTNQIWPKLRAQCQSTVQGQPAFNPNSSV